MTGEMLKNRLLGKEKTFRESSLFPAGLAAQEVDHAANGEVDRCGNAVFFPQRYYSTVDRIDLGGLV